MNYENILKLIQSEPYYKVELGITDYQDEGLKLDMYIWKDICNIREADTISCGDYEELYEQMITLNGFLRNNSINVSYIKETQYC